MIQQRTRPSVVYCTAALALLLTLTLSSGVAVANELLSRKSGSHTVVGYQDTPLLPATDNKYHVHDFDRPVPKHVRVAGPGADGAPAPSDAMVLFDGKDLSAWKPSSWKIEDGQLVAGGGSLATKEPLGDCQLHIEWMAPADPGQRMMNRGNSGVFMMGLYELQIFDSHPVHEVQIYADGQAASIYGQTPPLVNACRAPGEWQSFDIVFTAPRFEGERLVTRAKVTMRHNGVLVHKNQDIMGPTQHVRVAPYRPHPAKLPIVLQGHGSPVRFRNIWVRPLGGVPQ